MGLTYQMELILNITSYHRLSPEIEASKTTKHSLIFGRSEACDWHLPDPEKIISMYGSDTARWFMLSDSPPDRDLEWTENGIASSFKFINKFFKIFFHFFLL